MLKGKKILAVTLARCGSKGVRQKNIKSLLGRPLISYTITEAKKSRYIDDYIVSTDCSEIADIAKNEGADVPFLRPKKFSGDTASSASALIHSVNFFLKQNKKYDYVVELMATNPLKIAEDIDACIERAILNNHNSCAAVHRIWDQHPSRVKKIENGVLIDFYPEIPESRRQDLIPPAYIRSGSIYVTKVDFLLNANSRYGSNSTLAYILPESRVINIDEIDDFRLAEIKLKNRK